MTSTALINAGVLSFFALQAGARKVYAIEASNMAIHCRKLVTENKFADKMSVIIGKVEEVRGKERGRFCNNVCGCISPVIKGQLI